MGVVRLFDSLWNLTTGLGTPKDPTTASTYHLSLLNRNDLENAYRSDWIARRIVDAPAEDATREWRAWQANQDQIQLIEDEEKKHDLQRKLRLALIRSRLYGGAALVLGVNQGNPNEELELDKVGEGDLEFVVVLNRYELMAGPRIYDVDSPWYTRPQYYTVATPLFGFNEQGDKTTRNFQASGDSAFQVGSGAMIHPSRVIEFAGAELPDWRLIPMGGGWGDSVLQTVDETLKDIGLIVGGMANMVNDAKMDVIKIPNFSQNIATTEYANRLLARFAYANQSKSTVNSILLDKEEEWQRIQSNFGGLPNLLHEFFTVVAGAADMPLGRLMSSSSGRAMSGGGAATGGGEADLRGYYDRITSKQKTDYSPRMAPLDEVIVRSACGTYDNSIYYDWNPLWQITDAEKAKIALDKVNAMKIEIEMGLVNEDALRKAWVNTLVEDGTYSGLEDAIDEFGEEPEEPDVQEMWSRLAGALPPQINGPPQPKQLGAPAPEDDNSDGGVAPSGNAASTQGGKQKLSTGQPLQYDAWTEQAREASAEKRAAEAKGKPENKGREKSGEEDPDAKRTSFWGKFADKYGIDAKGLDTFKTWASDQDNKGMSEKKGIAAYEAARKSDSFASDLKKLPQYEGTVYRGMALTKAQFSGLKVGATTLALTTAASKSKNVASTYMAEMSSGNFDKTGKSIYKTGVVMQIAGAKGADFDKTMGSSNENKEVIIPKGSRIRIDSINKSEDYYSVKASFVKGGR